MTTFQFTSPGYAWLLLPSTALVFLSLFAVLAKRRFAGLFPNWLIHSPARPLLLLQVLLMAAAFVGIVLALMDPRGSPRLADEDSADLAAHDQLVSESSETMETVEQRIAHDVIFLLDVSASMGVSDTRLGLTRLEYAKEIIDEVVGQLNGQTVALYAFTSELTPLVPLTLDYLYTRLMLSHVRINEGDCAGTDLIEALDGLSRRHALFGDQKMRSIILLTDGGDTNLERAEGQEREREIEALLNLVRNGKTPMRLFTVGLGSHQGEIIPGLLFEEQPVRSSLDEGLLARLAEAGGGKYIFSGETSSLKLAEQLVHELAVGEKNFEALKSAPVVQVERTEKQESQLVQEPFGRWPLLLAIFSLLLAYSLSHLLSIRKTVAFVLLVASLTSHLHAADPLRETATEAAALMDAGEYQRAKALYEELVLGKLNEKQRLELRYNFGTACLRLKEWDSASGAFDEVVAAETAEPLLRCRAAINLAEVGLGRVGELELNNSGDFVMAFQLALKELGAADTAWERAVEIAKEAGEPDVSVFSGADILHLHQNLRSTLAIWLDRNESYQLQSGSYAALLEQLADKTEQQASRLERLELEVPVEARKEVLRSMRTPLRQLESVWEAAISRATQLTEQAILRVEEAQGYSFENATEAQEHSQVGPFAKHERDLALSNSRFRRCLEELGEGDGWSALVDQLDLAAELRCLKSLAEGKSPLEPALEMQVALEERLKSKSLISKQQTALRLMVEHRKSLVRRLCNEEKAETPIEELLISKLSDRVEAGSSALENLFFYRQIRTSEEETLTALRSDLKASTRLPDHLKERVLALEERLYSCLDLSTEDSEGKRLLATATPLREARAQLTAGRCDNRQLITLIDAALLAWNPASWLKSQVKEWQQECVQALAGKQVTTPFLQEILTDHGSAMRTLKEHGYSLSLPVTASLESFSQDCNVASKALAEGRSRSAEICLEDGSQALRKALADLENTTPFALDEILRRGISEESFARCLYQTAAKEADLERLDENVLDVLCGTQRRVSDQVSDFPTAFVQYAAAHPEKQEVLKDVSRLFEEGRIEGETAAAHIRKKKPDWAQADLSQEIAIQRWREALTLLNDGDQEDDSEEPPPESEESDEGEPPPEAEELNHENEEAAVSPAELFELLQQMDKEDRTPPPADAPLKQGLRPW